MCVSPLADPLPTLSQFPNSCQLIGLAIPCTAPGSCPWLLTPITEGSQGIIGVKKKKRALITGKLLSQTNCGCPVQGQKLALMILVSSLPAQDIPNLMILTFQKTWSVGMKNNFAYNHSSAFSHSCYCGLLLYLTLPGVSPALLSMDNLGFPNAVPPVEISRDLLQKPIPE